MWIADSACVSTSSVTKTLLTFSSRISGCEPLSYRHSPLLRKPRELSSNESGRNYRYCDMSERITWSPTFRPSLISMVLTELRPSCTFTLLAYLPSGSSFEELHSAILLPEYRPPDVHHVLELGQLDVPSTLRSGRAPGEACPSGPHPPSPCRSKWRDRCAIRGPRSARSIRRRPGAYR